MDIFKRKMVTYGLFLVIVLVVLYYYVKFVDNSNNNNNHKCNCKEKCNCKGKCNCKDKCNCNKNNKQSIEIEVAKNTCNEGDGKGFNTYYKPNQCCKDKGCFPGSYIGADFYKKNKPTKII